MMKFLAILCLVSLVFFISDVGAKNPKKDCLKYDYYKKTTCPQAEDVVAEMMKDSVGEDFRVAPRILRMHFHDCFVRGCEGSILLDSTPTEKAEKDARPNNPSLQGFDVINKIKAALEKQCPKVVSCADILAYAARESVKLTGKYMHYPVRGGRKDGVVSREAEALQNLPPPFANVDTLIKMFAAKNLTLEEMVTLSGGHSIGGSFCSSISRRYDNFNNTGKPDPTLNSDLAAVLRKQCASLTNRVVMDTITPTGLDNKYYTGLLQNKGLFTSDATLLTNNKTLKEVKRNVFIPSDWEKKFAKAMIKMGEIEVLTGDEGQIRVKCNLRN
ncbi:Peroxidase [Thalictrum thalictroides]|uniref:Peroxidase n=1 Tax=Thalictrum thalictroides TaxID=46969 RepID=A0A7J6X2N6_THATH|nr:Peroxidase [Thalictrum thalictroides]